MQLQKRNCFSMILGSWVVSWVWKCFVNFFFLSFYRYLWFNNKFVVYNSAYPQKTRSSNCGNLSTTLSCRRLFITNSNGFGGHLRWRYASCFYLFRSNFHWSHLKLVTNKWSIATLSQPRWSMCATWASQFVIFAGGQILNDLSNTVDIYDIGTFFNKAS